MTTFEDVYRQIIDFYRQDVGLPPLKKKEYMAESEEFLYADNDEPDRYRNEDERLDDPRHAQCVNGVFKE